jgi:hypothetical protein
MNSSTRKPSRRRRYPINRIKKSCSYDPADIAKLFGIHRNTVRHWLKEGLTAIDGRRPTLVTGAVLKAFIAKRQQAGRRTCALGEFFCFRCRAPRKPWGGMADFSIHTNKIIKATALCSVCETAMYRAIRRADLSKFTTLIEPQELPSERLEDRPDASANCDFGKGLRYVEIERAK